MNISLEPYGDLLDGKKGVSATRLAEHLGITPAALRKVAKPCGRMKIPYYNAFDVYRVTNKAIENLQKDPRVVKARQRREKRSSTASKAAAKSIKTRRKRCVEQLSRFCPELIHVYEIIVEKIWSPASEKSLMTNCIYSEYPPRLWQVLKPKPGYESRGGDVIANILWACLKERTWKVNEWRDQDVPLALQLIQEDPESCEELWGNMFAAAIRHMDYDDCPKAEGRKFAIEDLVRYSERFENSKWARQEQGLAEQP